MIYDIIVVVHAPILPRFIDICKLISVLELKHFLNFADIIEKKQDN